MLTPSEFTQFILGVGISVQEMEKQLEISPNPGMSETIATLRKVVEHALDMQEVWFDEPEIENKPPESVQ